MSGEPSFFEIGVEDVERGRAFYAALFGWTTEPGPGHGYMLGTGGIGGGMHGGDAAGGIYLFLAVDDLDAAVARVRELGGEIEEMGSSDDAATAARFGRFKLCRDDQGGRFGLHEPPP